MNKENQWAILGFAISGLVLTTRISRAEDTLITSGLPGQNISGSLPDSTGDKPPRTDSGAPDKNTVIPSGSGIADNASNNPTQRKGLVESIDRRGKRVRVRDNQGNIQEYIIDSKTTFRNQLKKVRFSEIKTGDAVTLGLNIDGQHLEQLEIEGRKQTVEK